MYGPSEVIQAIQVMKNNCDGQMPLVTQRVVSHLLEHIDYDEQIQKVCKVYQEKCHIMLDTFRQYGSSKVHLTEPTGGMFIWMTLPDHVDCDAFFEEAIARKVGIVKSGAFAADGVPYGQHFRLSYTVPSLEDIRKGMQIIGELTREYCGE